MRIFQQSIRNAAGALAFAVLALSGNPAAAQDKYPDHPIRMIPASWPTGWKRNWASP